MMQVLCQMSYTSFAGYLHSFPSYMEIWGTKNWKGSKWWDLRICIAVFKSNHPKSQMPCGYILKKNLRVSGNPKGRALVREKFYYRSHLLIYCLICWGQTLLNAIVKAGDKKKKLDIIPVIKEHHTLQGILFKYGGMLLGNWLWPVHPTGRWLSNFSFHRIALP